jgi:hypothetical protein
MFHFLDDCELTYNHWADGPSNYKQCNSPDLNNITGTSLPKDAEFTMARLAHNNGANKDAPAAGILLGKKQWEDSMNEQRELAEWYKKSAVINNFSIRSIPQLIFLYEGRSVRHARIKNTPNSCEYNILFN